MRVLAFDPGTRNLGWAVLEVETQCVVACGLHDMGVEPTLDAVAFECSLFVAHLRALWYPDAVYVERQMRDKMIAVAQSLMTAALCQGVPATIIHPATWMRRMGVRPMGSHSANKRRNLHLVQEDLGYNVDGDHNIADAVLIALSYGRQ